MLGKLECSVCGAPLNRKPSSSMPVKCEFCEHMNVYQPPAQPTMVSAGSGTEIDIDTSDQDYMIFQQTSELMEKFSSEYVGDEISKLRVKITSGPHDFKILLVLDDFPNSMHVELPKKLEEATGPFEELESIVKWDLQTSKLVDVFDEIKARADAVFEKDIEIPSNIYEDIKRRFDVEETKKELKVLLYSTIGEQHFVIIKKGKDTEFPKVTLGPILQTEETVQGFVSNYKRKEISIIVLLDFIEKFLMGQ
ncbi:MAG: hypothetical protein ACTSP4_09560 [Candidatus Hodarchaeales archaeon]